MWSIWSSSSLLCMDWEWQLKTPSLSSLSPPLSWRRKYFARHTRIRVRILVTYSVGYTTRQWFHDLEQDVESCCHFTLLEESSGLVVGKRCESDPISISQRAAIWNRSIREWAGRGVLVIDAVLRWLGDGKRAGRQKGLIILRLGGATYDQNHTACT